MKTTMIWRLTFALFLAALIGCSKPEASKSDNNKPSNKQDRDSSLAKSSGQTSAENAATGKTISIGQRLTIQSKILNQEREYLVYLPDSYDSDSGPYLPQSYPVLFLFDGDIQFHVLTGMVNYMSGIGGQIPEMIVVGVPHKNRTKELTPTHSTRDFREGKTSDQLKDSGGGEEFMAFVTRELIPRIDSDYRTRPYRVLFGHSFGGLLAAHEFLKNDSSFQSFILADPSLWWHDRILLKRLEQQVDSEKTFAENRTMYISSVSVYRAPGDAVTQKGFDNIKDSIREFEKLLASVKSVRFKAREFVQATHTSVPTQTIYHGLLHVFDGYEPPPEYFLGAAKKLNEHFKSVSDRVGLKLLPREQFVDMWGNAFLSYDEDFRKYAVPMFKLNTLNYPTSPNAHLNLGEAQLKLGKLDEARRSFKKVLKLDPDNESAKSKLGELPNQ